MLNIGESPDAHKYPARALRDIRTPGAACAYWANVSAVFVRHRTLHAAGKILKVHSVRYTVGAAGQYKLHVGLRNQATALPGSPFDLYVSPSSAHAPYGSGARSRDFNIAPTSRAFRACYSHHASVVGLPTLQVNEFAPGVAASTWRCWRGLDLHMHGPGI